MSTHIRTPRKMTVHCPVAGCKWLRTYFDLETRRRGILETWPAEIRARLGLNAHVGAKHPRPKVLINGR